VSCQFSPSFTPLSANENVTEETPIQRLGVRRILRGGDGLGGSATWAGENWVGAVFVCLIGGYAIWIDIG
jgi:hypothetical protein